MPRGVFIVARSTLLIGAAFLCVLPSSGVVRAADMLKVGDKVTTKKTWIYIWESPTTKSYVDRNQCTLPVTIERASSPWIFIRAGGKAGWVRMADFELAEKKREKKQGWTPPPDSSTWGATLDTAWPPPPSPLLAYAEDDAPSGKSKVKPPKAPATNIVAMPTGPIQVGDKIMPRDMRVALMYRAKTATKSVSRARHAANSSRHCPSSRTTAVKTVATAADIAWPVKVRQVKGDWLWVDEPDDRRTRGWIRRTDVMTLVDAPLYYTMRIMAAENPRNTAQWHTLRGKYRLSVDACRMAISDLTTAIELEPKNWRLYYDRSTAHSFAGFKQEELRDADMVISLHKSGPEGYFARGRARISNGNVDGAVEDLSTAISLDASWSSAFVARGTLMLAQGEYEWALADFTAARRLARDSESRVGALTWRSATNMQLHRYDDAMSDVEQGLLVAPQDAGLREQLLMLQCHFGTLPDGPAADSSKHQQAYFWYLRGIAQFRANEPVQALDSFDRALGVHPNFSECRMARAHVLCELGDYQGAQHCAAIGLLFDPQDTQLQQLKVLALISAYRFTAALDELSKMIEQKPPRNVLATIFETRCQLLQKLGQRDLALADIDNSLQLFPDCSNFLLTQSRLFLDLNLAEKVVANCDVVLASNGADRSLQPVKVDLTDGLCFQFEFAPLQFAFLPTVEQQQAAAQTEARLLRSRAQLLLGRCAESQADYEAVLERDSNCTDGLIVKAEFLARCSDEKLRNPEGALSGAKQACLACRAKKLASIGALAAAYAANGNFSTACFWQELVRDFAPNPLVRTEAEDRLTCYRLGRIATPAELVAQREARDNSSRN